MAGGSDVWRGSLSKGAESLSTLFGIRGHGFFMYVRVIANEHSRLRTLRCGTSTVKGRPLLGRGSCEDAGSVETKTIKFGWAISQKCSSTQRFQCSSWLGFIFTSSAAVHGNCSSCLSVRLFMLTLLAVAACPPSTPPPNSSCLHSSVHQVRVHCTTATVGATAI